MYTLRRLRRCALLALALLAVDRSPALAQQPPWTGVVADEARTAAPTGDGTTLLSPRSLSGDGRYLVFHSDRTLVGGDTNGATDVFLRDRSTGELTRVSVSTSGDEGNDASSYPSISRDGRHIIFSSCASNLVADDTNGVCDVFVRDRVLGTTVRVSLGPSGEEAGEMWSWLMYSISADGRYVVFGARFASSSIPYHQFYLRDRDGDVNGVFDEAGDSSTVLVSPAVVDGEELWGIDTPAISADGRWIAFSAGVMAAQSNWLGFRMFVHDRNTSTTVRIDRPPVAETQQHHSASPDFSDHDELVYFTSVPNLVPEDTDGGYDVYVFNLLTGGHTHITQTHDADTYHWWEHEQYPAISADGRYVAFAGNGIQDHRDVYVVDRATNTSYTLNKAADGSIDANGNQPTYGIVAMSADGAHVAFEGSAAILANGAGLTGIFVSSAVSIAPEEIEAPQEAGTYTFDVNVPAGIAWTLTWDSSTGLESVTPTSGTGPMSVEVSVLENPNQEDRSHVITLGSEQVAIHQRTPLTIEWLSPSDGATTGGDEIGRAHV